MCCLGVLCELARRSDLPVHTARYRDVTFYEGRSMYPPDSVRRWAGLVGDASVGEGHDIYVTLDRDVTVSIFNTSFEDGNTYTLPAGTNTGLGELNDGGVPFETIADIIEKCM